MTRLKEKYATFVLNSNHVPSDERRMGTNREVSIPAKDVILEEDKSGRLVKRLIAYNPNAGERSIYVDEWKHTKFDGDIRNLNIKKIDFNSPFKVLDPVRYGLLVEFLEKTNLNESNPNRDTSYEAIFYQDKQEAKATDKVDKAEKVHLARTIVFEGRHKRLQEIGELLGVKTVDKNGVDLTENELKANLIDFADKDPDSLISITEDPRLDMRVQIHQAAKIGVIFFDEMNRNILYRSNKASVIQKKIPRGHSYIDVLVDYCAETGSSGKLVYDEILDRMYKGVESKEEKIELLESDPSIIKNMTSSDLVDACKDAGILYMNGAYLSVTGFEKGEGQIGKGKKAAIDMIEAEKEEDQMLGEMNLKLYLESELDKAIKSKMSRQ